MDGKLKIGVFGVQRGQAFIKALKLVEEAKVVAICDFLEDKIEKAKEICPEGVKVFSDFDEMLESGIDAVILCNYFNEHAPYAIKALKKGIHVLSECIPASTLKECAELVDAAENSSAVYEFAENYPHSRACKEITRVFQSGVLGELSFAEGEYVHPMSVAETARYHVFDGHWRTVIPKTYYLSHALAPLMTASGLMPKRVIGKVAVGWEYAKERGRTDGDGGGIMLVEMESGALFRIAGSCGFGSRANWYRLCCQKGEIENIRGTSDRVRLAINSYDKTEETSGFGSVCVYEPAIDEQGRKALSCGHSGGDYWVTWNFVQDVLNKKEPFMNVYRAAAIAATGILGWRSVLNDSRQMDIPDFRDKAARAALYDDDLTPFVTNGKPGNLRNVYFRKEDKPEGKA